MNESGSGPHPVDYRAHFLGHKTGYPEEMLRSWSPSLFSYLLPLTLHSWEGRTSSLEPWGSHLTFQTLNCLWNQPLCWHNSYIFTFTPRGRQAEFLPTFWKLETWGSEKEGSLLKRWAQRWPKSLALILRPKLVLSIYLISFSLFSIQMMIFFSEHKMTRGLCSKFRWNQSSIRRNLTSW